jgi:excisionase family DNA binding protein
MEGQQYITVAQAARQLNVHPRTVTRLIEKGRLPALDVGTGRHKDYRIDPADLASLRFEKPPTLPDKPHVRRARRGGFRPLLRVG